MDQANDPVAYAHAQEAGRIPGPQTANDVLSYDRSPESVETLLEASLAQARRADDLGHTPPFEECVVLTPVAVANICARLLAVEASLAAIHKAVQ